MAAALDTQAEAPTPEQLEQAALLERELVERARDSLLAFTLYTFDGDYEVNWHHRVLAQKLDAFVRGDITRLIITMPPRHGKSELASRRLPAYILGRDPNARIIACSYGLDLALDMSRDAKRVVTSPAYQRVFPDTRLPSAHVVTDSREPYKNTADQWQIVGHRGQYLARGVGGGITGKGGDFLIVDDPIKDDEEAQSETYREKVWRWYTKVFKTRAAKNARILVIMTRWHEDDLVGRLLERARQSSRADQWEVVKFEALRQMRVERDEMRRQRDVAREDLAAAHEALADQQETISEEVESRARLRIQLETLERERAEQDDELEKLRNEMIRAEEVAQTWRAGLTEARERERELAEALEALLEVAGAGWDRMGAAAKVVARWAQMTL